MCFCVRVCGGVKKKICQCLLFQLCNRHTSFCVWSTKMVLLCTYVIRLTTEQNQYSKWVISSSTSVYGMRPSKFTLKVSCIKLGFDLLRTIKALQPLIPSLKLSEATHKPQSSAWTALKSNRSLFLSMLLKKWQNSSIVTKKHFWPYIQTRNVFFFLLLSEKKQ